MNPQLNSMINQFHWLSYHEDNNPDKDDPNSCLAYQDSFIRYLPVYNQDPTNQATAILHFYPLKKPSILLGGKDTRLPYLEQGIQYLKDSGYQVVVRPHGGLAVVNDPGVLNLAMVLDQDYLNLTIDQAYTYMVDLIRASLADYKLPLDSYEVTDSYCPGKFDLVVRGQKIGGIAQRRFKSGVTVAAYISVNGIQKDRSQVVKEFYQVSGADASYPKVNLSSMTSLTDYMDQDLSLADYEEKVRQSFPVLSEPSYQEDPVLTSIYQDRLQQAHQRSQKL